MASRTHPDAVLVDIGTTTTDIIPIVAGRVAAAGWTDPERLASGELLYTGAARTPVEAMAADVCVQGRRYTLAAEGFATSADVHVWRGDLDARGVTGGTADGRPATRPAAGDRLARALCADRELMDDAAITGAGRCAGRRRRSIASRRRSGASASPHPSIRHAVVAGAGAFVAARAARAAGLDVVALADVHGAAASLCAPAAAVALLLGDGTPGASPRALSAGVHRGGIDAVVKIGGSLLADPEALREVLDLIERAPVPLLVVPGGGPFADAVRDADRRLALGDDAAHWMAVLAMDQYAELLVARLPRAVRVTETARRRARRCRRARLPVLAPSRWLRDADPLPHSWDVTSDSIAAWVAGQAGRGRSCS